MAFKIGTKKILSEQNISNIIMLGIGLRDELSNMELGLISDYDNTKTYTRGQAVYYNNYLYKCLYTTTGEFDNTKWQKIGDELNLLTKQDIEAMLNLTDEQLKTLQSLILDTSIELSHVWSSSKTYGEIQNAIKKGEAFTLKELSKKMGASYKVVTTTDEVTSTEFLYLISNSTAYDIYALIDGVVTKLGDTTIDLSNYYTKNEIDSDFLKKTDADGKYITQTSFNSHASDTDIHITTAERTKWNEVDNKVNKTDIATTIDISSTETQVPSAKSVYDNTDNIFDTRLENNPPSYYYNNHNQHVVREMKLTTAIGINNSEIGFVTLLTYVNWCDISAPIYQMAIHYKQILIRNNIDGDTWTKWQRLCPTSVGDIPITDITIPNGLFQTVDSDSSYIKYEVVNGIAFVYFSIRGAKMVGSGISRNITIPKLKTSFNHTIIGEGCTSNLTILANGTNMQIWTLGDEIVTTNYSGCISYPVAESYSTT